MHEQIAAYLETYPAEVASLFRVLRKLIYDSVPAEPEEKLWAKLPSYTVGDAFVRLIPFKDHINIEAQAAICYRDSLPGYKFTPKGMLQLYLKQKIPQEILKQIFSETLG